MPDAPDRPRDDGRGGGGEAQSARSRLIHVLRRLATGPVILGVTAVMGAAIRQLVVDVRDGHQVRSSMTAHQEERELFHTEFDRWRLRLKTIDERAAARRGSIAEFSEKARVSASRAVPKKGRRVSASRALEKEAREDAARLRAAYRAVAKEAHEDSVSMARVRSPRLILEDRDASGVRAESLGAEEAYWSSCSGVRCEAAVADDWAKYLANENGPTGSLGVVRDRLNYQIGHLRRQKADLLSQSAALRMEIIASSSILGLGIVLFLTLVGVLFHATYSVGQRAGAELPNTIKAAEEQVEELKRLMKPMAAVAAPSEKLAEEVKEAVRKRPSPDHPAPVLPLLRRLQRDVDRPEHK